MLDTSMSYKTTISDCDISDKTFLAEFRAFRDRVAELLRGDEEHSISAQLLELFWHDATFRTFNEARRTNTADRRNAAIAPLLANYLDNAYIQSEVLAVSRLTDPPAEEAKLGVVSLPTVIKVLRDNIHLVTREMYVCYDGLPFDCEAAAADEHAATPFVSGVRWMAVPPSDYSRWAHNVFDRLSGKAADRRHREDRIKPGVLRWLERQIQGEDISKIRLHRNKVLAHKADRTSRGAGPAARLGLSLNGIDALHKRLLNVAEVLSWATLGEVLVGTPIATPQYDQLEGLDSVFAFPEDLESLENLWRAMSAEKENWCVESLDDAPCKIPPLRPAGGTTKMTPPKAP